MAPAEKKKKNTLEKLLPRPQGCEVSAIQDSEKRNSQCLRCECGSEGRGKCGITRKGQSGKARAWLKKDVAYEPPQQDVQEDGGALEEETEDVSVGSKRKRVDEPEALQQQHAQSEIQPAEKTTSTRSSRQDKRRKPTLDATPASAEPEHELIPIDKLPADRQKIAIALSKILLDDFNNRAKGGVLDIPSGQTAQSFAEQHALGIENALKISHEGPGNPQYTGQWRSLNANLKKNRELIARLLDGSLTYEELSTMSTADMASEELQRQRAVMKEQLDRQAVAVEVAEGPRYRRTHKGDELIEDENAAFKEGVSAAQPVRERSSVQDIDEAGSPTAIAAGSPEPLKVDTVRSPSVTQSGPRRQSSQQFDMNNIWAKTAQSPTSSTFATGGAGGARPMQMPPKRRSSVKQQPSQDGGTPGGTKEDADVDRMLQDDDDDETYSPAEYSDSDGIVWRGKLLQAADAVSPAVNARFVAGRDLTNTVTWRDLLPPHLSIDGRLQIGKAEEYLCSLQWSQSSDVSVLALTPYDDADGFEKVWQYFRSRERYAVVNKDKPLMVKDLYIIPVEAGQEVPSHVGMLEFNRLGASVDQKCLLASLVVARGATAGAPSGLDGAADAKSPSNATPTGANGQQRVLPQHMRGAAAAAGPAGSPLHAAGATFSPTAAGQHQLTAEGGHPASLPPNPYTGPPQQQAPPPAAAYTNPLVNEILGPLQYAPTAQNVVGAEPGISREKLEHLRSIMERYPATRTDLAALFACLEQGG
jgi:hypothetical protein